MAGFADLAAAREQEKKMAQLEIVQNLARLETGQKALATEVEKITQILSSDHHSNAVSSEAIQALNKSTEKMNTSIQAILRDIKPHKEISLKERILWDLSLIICTSIVMSFVYGIGDTRDELDYIRNRINVIHWNQTTGTMPGARTYSPWEMSDFTRSWNNQNAYIKQFRQENGD